MPAPIVLLTDFGESDPFVGIMKGVILSRFSGVRIVDLTHQIPPQDVRIAGFYLMASVSYFPEGSVFVCVVDPGVGTERHVLWARTQYHQFLAPDNGLLSWVDRRASFKEIRRVTNRRLFLDKVSTTFHGRDIFAPVAAELARGGAPASLGPRVSSLKRIAFPEPRRHPRKILGSVLAVDRFGNAITNMMARDVPAKAQFWFRDKNLGRMRTHFAEVSPGRPVVVSGSLGFVELSVRNGSFASAYGAALGDPLEAKFG